MSSKKLDKEEIFDSNEEDSVSENEEFEEEEEVVEKEIEEEENNDNNQNEIENENENDGDSDNDSDSDESEDDNNELLHKTFEDLGLSSWLIDATNNLSMKRPTEIQSACIPEILAGNIYFTLKFLCNYI